MTESRAIEYDNASQRLKPSAFIYNIGVKEAKKRILETINKEYAALHNEGKVHIHDLEMYKYTYNCLQLDVLQDFPYAEYSKYSQHQKIMELVRHYESLVNRLGHEQSGGIGFPNIDEEISVLFERLDIQASNENLLVLKDAIELFIDWLNQAHERNCQYSFYVTLNLGLSTSKVGRFVTRSIIEYFKNTSLDVIKPNIVFKLKRGVNYLPDDPNYDLYLFSLESSCKKMIPTYLLFDSIVNSSYDPYKVAIMGCRTRVVENLFGEPGSIGRGNIAYITINLPRIALEVDHDFPNAGIEEKYTRFKMKWKEIAIAVRDILIDRYKRLLELSPDKFPCNCEFQLWLKDFRTAENLADIFKDGTLSIGFIGLSEVVDILSGRKFYLSNDELSRAVELVKYMREVVDGFRKESQLNLTLLASSGEMISGRFPELDRKVFNHPILEKGFYTNSFHVEVDSCLHPIVKIQYEGPFHAYCNGGSISYVEFASAPLRNIEAVKEVIDAGILNGINYLGINFPLDECRSCGEMGTFDSCNRCGGKDIHRIRRVSGYLEDLDFFTPGKKAEERRRRPNAFIHDRVEE
jgi:ribonucleoside-triphosphate reductase